MKKGLRHIEHTIQAVSYATLQLPSIQDLMCLTVWWRTIELGNATGVGDKKLGKYLEDKYLDGLGKPYGEHAEWHATEVGQAQLEKLCIDLDGKRDQNKPWWTSDFKDVDDLDKLFNHKFK